MSLVLKADILNILKWWVDESFATYDDTRGHTGSTISLRKGSIARI
jgi:hypothetical protein